MMADDASSTGQRRALASTGTAARLVALEAAVAELVERVDRIAIVIGRSPNPATGEAGSGVCKVLSEIATDRELGRKRVIKVGAYAGAGGAGIAMLVELGMRLVNLLGG